MQVALPSRNSLRMHDVRTELPFGICYVDNQQCDQKQFLVSVFEIVNDVLCLTGHGQYIRGHDIHIITLSDGSFLVVDLDTVQIGGCPLGAFDGLLLIHTVEMKTD